MSRLARAQYAAVAQMRWRTLLNSLRTGRGRFELGSRIVTTGFFALIWAMASFGLGVMARQAVTRGRFDLLALLLWPVLLAWLSVPLVLASYGKSADLSLLLRFPVSFLSYTLLYLFSGLFDLSSLLGGIAFLGIWAGVVTARPHLMLWTAVVLLAFAVFNVLLTRTIFAWIERWLAQRRTREILGIVFLSFFLALQLLNPVFHRQGGGASSIATVLQTVDRARQVQHVLPPGLAGRAIATAAQGRRWGAVAALGWLTLYGAGTGVLLSIRLRAEYRGESLGETTGSADRRRARAAQQERPVVIVRRKRWARWERADPIPAVIEKELRYLSRSGVMLFGVVAPLIFLFFAGGADRSGHARTFQYALPLGVAYAFLPLTRLISNSLGGEGGGIQLYFLAPTPFRTVMLGKNLLQIALLWLELLPVCSIVLFRYGMPKLEIVAATFCWLLFALPLELAAGNVLSITMAYRMTLTRLSREEGSMGNGLLSLLVQLLVFGAGAGVYLPLARLGHGGLAAPVFLLLAVGGVFLWVRVLSNVNEMANRRREALVETLVRTS